MRAAAGWSRIGATSSARSATRPTSSPSGRKPWWQELPPAGAEAWAERAARRKRRDRYRLALIFSKFRVGEEPDPFVLELDLSQEPWQLRDVTAEITRAAETSQEQRTAQERSATAQLHAEIRSRVMLRGEAVDFLQALGMGRNQADRIIRANDGHLWRLVPVPGQRGHGQRLEPIKYAGGNNGEE